MNFNRWFKAQGADFLDMRLRKLPAGLFKHFYFMRCVAACNGGALPPVEQLAFLLGSRVGVVERRLAALREAGLLAMTDGEWRIVDRAGDDGDAPEPLSGADRTRRWRERRAGAYDVPRDDAGDEAVTIGDSIEEDREEETDSARPARGATAGDRFDEFLAAFPQREGGQARQPALAAWRVALAAGADPERMLAAARAYGAAMVGREKRFVVSAVRWLSEERWRGAGGVTGAPNAPAGEPGVWIALDSPEGRAWGAHWLAAKSKGPPLDARGGWRFPSRWPPAGKEAALVAAE